jgi:hypothetical protein
MQPVWQTPLAHSWCTGHSPSARQVALLEFPPHPAASKSEKTNLRGQAIVAYDRPLPSRNQRGAILVGRLANHPERANFPGQDMVV